MASFLKKEKQVSLCRQNFNPNCEAEINRHVNLNLQASYTFQAMAFYFDRDDVALPGFSKFFKASSDEEREHARKFMAYQATRGGRVVFQDIKKCERDEWGAGLEAMHFALELEKKINASLLELSALADTHDDPQFADFLDSEFLGLKVKTIKEMGDHVTNLKRVGPGLGEQIYDRETLGE